MQIEEPCQSCDYLEQRNKFLVETCSISDDSKGSGQGCCVEEAFGHYQQKLNETQKHFKRLSDATLDGIVIHKEGIFFDVNQQFADMFGYSIDEILGTDGMFLLTPQSQAIVQENIASQSQTPYEAIGVKKDGTQFPIEIQARMSELDGDTVRIATCKDLTQRKRFHEELKAVFESSRDHIIVLEKNYTQLYINKAALDAINMTPEQAGIGKRMHDSLGDMPDLLNLWIDRVDEAFRTEKPMRVEDEVSIGDLQMNTESILSPIRYPDGKMFAVGIVARDVTEQKMLEKQLKESEQKYKDLYQNARACLFRSRISDGLVLDFSRATARLLGYTNRADFENSFSASDTYMDPKQRELLIETLIKNKRVHSFEVQLKRKDGSPVWVALSVEIFPEKDYIEGAMQDISVKKVLTKAEKEILEYLMQSLSNKEIAFKTGRSVRTIEDHRAHIMHKLEVDNIVDLTQKALKLPNHYRKE